MSITNSRGLHKPISIESVMPPNYLILCRPLLLLSSIFPSIMVFSNEPALLIRGPKYWSFSFNISPSNEQPGLVSFRMDWLDLLPVQGTLKSLLQHHHSKASILWPSSVGREVTRAVSGGRPSVAEALRAHASVICLQHPDRKSTRLNSSHHA